MDFEFLHLRSFIAFSLFCCLTLAPPGASARQSTQTAFSPSPAAIKLVVNTIGHAESSIKVAAYSFTSEKVSGALLDAHTRGVEVRVLLDKRQAAHHYPAIEELRTAGIPIRINRHYAIMHDKYLIIDDKTVETGSFNYTGNAERHNAENVIRSAGQIIFVEPETVAHPVQQRADGHFRFGVLSLYGAHDGRSLGTGWRNGRFDLCL